MLRSTVGNRQRWDEVSTGGPLPLQGLQLPSPCLGLVLRRDCGDEPLTHLCGEKPLRFSCHPGTLYCQGNNALDIEERPSWSRQPGHQTQGSGREAGFRGRGDEHCLPSCLLSYRARIVNSAIAGIFVFTAISPGP